MFFNLKDLAVWKNVIIFAVRSLTFNILDRFMESIKYLNDKYAINKWVFFCFNYPYDFIERCWSDAPMLAEHIRSKFNDYGGDMNRLYCELDKSNGNKLLEWVMDNYNSERKLFG